MAAALKGTFFIRALFAFSKTLRSKRMQKQTEFGYAELFQEVLSPGGRHNGNRGRSLR